MVQAVLEEVGNKYLSEIAGSNGWSGVVGVGENPLPQEVGTFEARPASKDIDVGI